VTKRVIAMGFPSTGCEVIYRNSVKETKRFFKTYHTDVKIYNLCLEKNRIYDKNIFSEFQVALYPFTDHDPCPLKLMLEFCIDLFLYLTKNPEGVAGVHCKAGKGRTGVMLICYLLFSGLFQNSDEAMEYYAKIRTKNAKVLK
jgi:phosphatidylinositol-3,4,5-trisphosphate 3-phosphatase/dual-specificity protein phosphatase PTEN